MSVSDACDRIIEKLDECLNFPTEKSFNWGCHIGTCYEQISAFCELQMQMWKPTLDSAFLAATRNVPDGKDAFKVTSEDRQESVNAIMGHLATAKNLFKGDTPKSPSESVKDYLNAERHLRAATEKAAALVLRDVDTAKQKPSSPYTPKR